MTLPKRDQVQSLPSGSLQTASSSSVLELTLLAQLVQELLALQALLAQWEQLAQQEQRAQQEWLALRARLVLPGLD